MYHHAVADLWQNTIIKLMLNSNPKSPVYDFFLNDYIYLVSSPSIPGSMQMSQLARGGNSGLGELETDPAPKGGKAATASCYAYIHINVSLSILISRNSVAR
jgi:hypothetical protein